MYKSDIDQIRHQFDLYLSLMLVILSIVLMSDF